MTITHRNKATNTSSSFYAREPVVNRPPHAVSNLSIRVPETVHTINSYSALDSDKDSTSDSDKDLNNNLDSEKEFTWNDAKSDSDDDMPPLVDSDSLSNETADNDSDEDMPPLVDPDDLSNETVDNDSDDDSDEDTRVSEQEEDFVSVKSSDEEESEDDIIVNHKQYRRVRTDKRCKDGIPPAITWAFFFFALAQFMQLVFLICKNVPHRHCISDRF